MFVIRPPADDSPGAYILIIQRGGGMMSPASATAYAIDRLDLVVTNETPLLHKGYIGDTLVVEFPYGTPYTLVARSLVKQISQAEAALEQWADEKELGLLEAGWRKDNPDLTQGATDSHTAGLANGTMQGFGQYL